MKWELIIYLLIFLNNLSSSAKYQKESEFVQKCINKQLLNDIPSEKPVPLISVVTPVYNKEEFLESTIRSIQNQNFKDFEIIIVEDGSTDNSLNIIKNLMEEDPRIVLIKNPENKGTIYSRFIGALHANGKYLMQVDADDNYCSSNSFETVYNVIKEKNVDIVHFSILSGNLTDMKHNSFMSPRRYSIVEQPELRHHIKKNGLGCFQWSKMYTRKTYLKAFEFIGKDFYEEHHCFLEDKIVTFSIFRTAESYIGISNHLLWYHYHKNTISTAPFSPYKLYNAFRTYTFLYTRSDDTVEDKLEFSKAIVHIIKNNNNFLKGLNDSPDSKQLYFKFCEKYKDNKLVGNDARKVLNTLCQNIGYNK